jgi:uncharacterized membrane protein required for colicin V production
LAFSQRDEVGSMPSVGIFNWFDVVIFLVVAGGLLVGYSQGLLRQVVGLAALYLATIVATQYYIPFSNFIYGMLFLNPSRFVNVVSFLVIFFGISALINVLAADAYQMTKLKLFPTIDQLGGAFLGLVTTVILLGLFIPILQFVSVEPLPYIDSVRATLVDGIANSRFVPAFLAIRHDLLNTIAPWLPNGQIPSIFNL